MNERSVVQVAAVKFASDLGWRPGYWPNAISEGSELWERHHVLRDGENDVIGMSYRSADRRREMVIYND